jgi:hypothetical protein
MVVVSGPRPSVSETRLTRILGEKSALKVPVLRALTIC